MLIKARGALSRKKLSPPKVEFTAFGKAADWKKKSACRACAGNRARSLHLEMAEALRDLCGGCGEGWSRTSERNAFAPSGGRLRIPHAFDRLAAMNRLSSAGGSLL